MSINPYQKYQQNSVMTASPGELTLMLYEGCLKFIKQGREAIKNQDRSTQNTVLQKAQTIINELIVTLDRKQPISDEMLPLYDYINRRLIEANIKNDPTILDEAEELVTNFRDAWREVIKITRKKQPQKQTGLA
ncbi:flagellar export chaperone FliS [Terrilactibacillus sp. BCM23-1]|uniref:Flagellar secretion chaperone FliS n=1 Tax=Terrilactibacillus tamarindi TaxID=2599694 RepID=A0A6N8CR65_9BACI|nr:flagellar export chaperone FliS [Terrilactibacillus tamarindi]MTT31573.1 flagellar export chaperone FliS [Terrilactibacillus tamarindi]